MSEKDHHYQGRQSALQVFKDFAGGVGGDPDLDDEDDDDDDEDVKMKEEQNVQEEVCETMIGIVIFAPKKDTCVISCAVKCSPSCHLN